MLHCKTLDRGCSVEVRHGCVVLHTELVLSIPHHWESALTAHLQIVKAHCTTDSSRFISVLHLNPVSHSHKRGRASGDAVAPTHL